MKQKDAYQLLYDIDSHSLLTAANYSVLMLDEDGTEYIPDTEAEAITSFDTFIRVLDKLGRLTDGRNDSDPDSDSLVYSDSLHVRLHQYKHAEINNESKIEPYFRKTNDDKSYLLSVLVSDEFYEIVKTNLIRYAQLIIDNEGPGNWHMKVITHTNKPFNLLNVFITNSQIMQIVNLGYDLAAVLTYLNNLKINPSYINRSLDSAQIMHVRFALMKPVYIWQPENMPDIFSKQLIDVNHDDIQPVVQQLTELVQTIVAHAHHDGNQKYYVKHRTSFDVMDLDHLMLQAHEFQPAFKSEYYQLLDMDSFTQKHPDLKPLINKLLHQMNN